jgi:putative endonuclease
MYSTYILWSEKLKKYYIGHTDDLSRRLGEHNAGRSQYTKHGTPWVLTYTENFNTRCETRRREQEIKRRKSKKYIEHLIQSNE